METKSKTPSKEHCYKFGYFLWGRWSPTDSVLGPSFHWHTLTNSDHWWVSRLSSTKYSTFFIYVKAASQFGRQKSSSISMFYERFASKDTYSYKAALEGFCNLLGFLRTQRVKMRPAYLEGKRLSSVPSLQSTILTPLGTLHFCCRYTKTVFCCHKHKTPLKAWSLDLLKNWPMRINSLFP